MSCPKCGWPQIDDAAKLRVKVREMWKAFCPSCKYHHSNGAGIACRDNHLKTPSFRNCPLLKGKVKK